MLLATKSPLCPTSVSLHGPGLFENAFPLVHLAPPIHPLGLLSGNILPGILSVSALG